MHTLEQLKDYENQFFKWGYFVLDLNDFSLVEESSRALESHLKKITANPEITLKNYHHYYDNDVKHYDIQYQMLLFFREQQFAQKIIASNLDVYQFILGPDLDIQAEPYLRITRPSKPKDNIGFHRDTFYGTGPGEISTVIPFVELSEKNALSVYPSSHTYPDSNFPIKQTQSEDVVKNSKKHKMGFPYAPKLMSEDIAQFLTPVPLKFGQALVFMLSTVHGSDENKTTWPRWSTDIRVRNSLTPLNENMKEGYYKPLKASVLTQTFAKLSS